MLIGAALISCVIAIHITVAKMAVGQVSEEKRLIKGLMDDYAKIGIIGRPVKNQNDTCRVEFGLHLIQIMDLDERNQILTTNVWCNYKWSDFYLKWDEWEYGGTNKIRIPIQNIWKPDFVLYNYVGERYTEQSDAMAVITSDGTVTWMPPAILKSTCEVDATLFPFDEQKCSMKFGSWTYNRHALDPFFYENHEFITLDDYMPSNEWTILQHSGQKNIKTYECCPNEHFPDLTFHLRLHRKATFYNYVLILPSVMLSAMTLVMFVLPPESPAKISLGVNILAAFFLLLLILKDATPTASHRIPLIGVYYCFNMVVTTVSTILCAAVVNLHFGADKRHPPPKCLKMLINGAVGRMMCVPCNPKAAASNKKSPSPRTSIYQIEHRQSVRSIGLAETERNNLLLCSSSGYRPDSPNNLLTYQRQRLTSLPVVSKSPSPSRPNNDVDHLNDGNRRRLSNFPHSPPPSVSLKASIWRQADTVDEQAQDITDELAELREIKALVSQFLQKTQTREHSLKGSSDWRVMSRVLDRLFFVLYILSMVISLVFFWLYPAGEVMKGHLHNDTAIKADERGNH